MRFGNFCKSSYVTLKEKVAKLTPLSEGPPKWTLSLPQLRWRPSSGVTLMQINRYRPLKPPLWYHKVPCEKNRMLNPRKKFAQCVESFQKQTLGVTFNSKNSQLYNYSLPREDIFSSTRPESTCGFLAGVVLSREKCHYQKPVR